MSAVEFECGDGVLGPALGFLFGMRRPVLTIFIAHLVASGLALLVVGLWKPLAFKSGLFGCLVFVGPNTYFAHYLFRYSGAKFSSWIVRSVYWGQMGKMLLTMVGMAMVFRFVKELDFQVFAGVYAVMLIAHIAISGRLAHHIK